MINIRGLTIRFLPNDLSLACTGLALVASLAYLFYLWSKPQRSSTSEAFNIAATLSIALLASPHTHYHDCILLAAAAAVTLESLSIRQAARHPRIAYRIWALLLMLYPFASWLCYITRDDQPLPILTLLNAALAASAGVLAVQARSGDSNNGQNSGTITQ